MNSQCVLNITFGWHLVEERDYSELKTEMTMRKIVHNFLQDQSLTDKKNVHEESWLHTSWLVRPRVQGSLINITYEAVSINVLKLTTYGYTDLQKRCWFFFVFSIFFLNQIDILVWRLYWYVRLTVGMQCWGLCPQLVYQETFSPIFSTLFISTY